MDHEFLTGATFLDEPATIDWGPSGITFTTLRGITDTLSSRQLQQAEVRMRVENAVRPAITVKQLAVLAGVKPRAIYGLVEGHRAPTLAALRSLAKALDKAGL